MNTLTRTISNSITGNNLKLLLSHISNITDLESAQDIKISITPNNIHIYTAIKSGNFYSSYKGLLMQTNELFENDINDNYHWIIYKCSEFIKLINNYSKDSNIDVIFHISNKSNYVAQIELSDSKIDMNYLGGDRFLVPEIEPNHIQQLLKSQNKLVTVKIPEDLFKQIKNLNKAKLKREDKLKDVVSVDIQDGQILFSDLRWKVKLADTNAPNQQFFFKKKFLTQTIMPDAVLNFYDKFMLIEDGEYKLLAALELSEL